MPLTRRHAIVATAGAAALALAGRADAATLPLVAVTAIVEHPALDACRDGIKAALAEAGFKDGQTIRFVYESAQGQPATAVQIARKFVGDAPAVIVPISTPSTQAVLSATKEIPIVFTAVTDPIGAGLVKSFEAQGGNITGVSDMSPVPQHVTLMLEIIPQLKTIGVVYNPGEANAVTLVNLLKETATARGLKVVEAPANKSGDVQAATQRLIGDVDAIYVPTDNTVVSALEALLGVAKANKVPVFAGDTDSVKRGAIATVGANYFEVGRQTGVVVARVLKGEKPGSIAIASGSGTDLVVNPTAATGFGVTIPEAVIARAKEVVGG